MFSLLLSIAAKVCSINHSFKNQTGSVVRPEKTLTESLTGFLRVTGPTNKKPEKLHKNNVFS
jgi:hypothetical protein